jgi:hypothetical protein
MMRTVKWSEADSSDAGRCDECNTAFTGGETRLIGEDENHNQFIIHEGCKERWKKRTNSVDA